MIHSTKNTGFSSKNEISIVPNTKRVMLKKRLPDGYISQKKSHLINSCFSQAQSPKNLKTQSNSQIGELVLPQKFQRLTEYKKKFIFSDKNEPNTFDSSIYRLQQINEYTNKQPLDSQTTNQIFYKNHNIQRSQECHKKELSHPFPFVYSTSKYNEDFFYCPVSPMQSFKEKTHPQNIKLQIQKETTYNKEYNIFCKDQTIITQLVKRPPKIKLGDFQNQYERNIINPKTPFQQEHGKQQLDTLFANNTPIFASQFKSELNRNFQYNRFVTPLSPVKNDPKIKIFLG